MCTIIFWKNDVLQYTAFYKNLFPDKKPKTLDIFNFWLENDRNPINVINWISAKFNRSVNVNCMTTVKKQINNFSVHANDKCVKNRRSTKPVLENERMWLSHETVFKLLESDLARKKRPSLCGL